MKLSLGKSDMKWFNIGNNSFRCISHGLTAALTCTKVHSDPINIKAMSVDEAQQQSEELILNTMIQSLAA